MEAGEAFQRLAFLAIGAVVLGIAIQLALWLMQLQGVFALDRLLTKTSPIAWITLIAILVFGGFYLVVVAFRTLYAAFS